MKVLNVNLLLFICLFIPHQAITSPDIGELPNENQVPRLVTMNFYHDAGKEMAFRWNTTYKTDSDLEMVLARDGNFDGEHVLSFQGTCEKSQVANDGFIHSVVATGLTPNETYLYRVGDRELQAWSSIGRCQTETDDSTTFFVHISDPQVFEEAHVKSYQETLQIIDQMNPNFICITGDIVNNSWEGYTPNLEQWEWAITEQETLRNYSVMSVAGNHEAAAYDFTSRYHFPYAEGQDLSTGGYYSFDYHNIHFVALNTNDSCADAQNLRGLSTTQLHWLENDLKQAQDAPWKIVMLHKGLYDAGGHCSNLEGTDGDIALIREQLTPLFDQYEVDLVLQGHDHLYSRSYPITSSRRNGAFYPQTKDETKVTVTQGDQSYDVYQDPSGSIYVNTGSSSGSKYYGVVNYDKEMIPLEKAHGSNYKMFTSYQVCDDGLYANVYEMKDGQAVLYDSFGIVKTMSHAGHRLTIGTLVTLILLGCAIFVFGLTMIVIYICKKKKGALHHG